MVANKNKPVNAIFFYFFSLKSESTTSEENVKYKYKIENLNNFGAKPECFESLLLSNLKDK